MIGRQYQGGSVDEVAVRRDDELLELLGRRTAPRHADPAGSLLWALTLDVDRDIAVAAPAAPQVVLLDAIDSLGERRRHGARGTVIGVVVAATLSVSGVAAAVTGDPLSPYRAVISLAQDDEPPAARRGAAPDPATIRWQGTTTGQTGGLVAAPDVALGRAAVGGAQVFGASAAETSSAGKPAKEHQTSGRPDGTTGRPENPGRSADRAEGAKEAKEAKEAKAARRAKAAQQAKDEQAPPRAETAETPQPRRPEAKAQRDKP